MARALGIAAAVGLGTLAGCRGSPSARPPAPDQPVGRASGLKSDASGVPPSPDPLAASGARELPP